MSVPLLTTDYFSQPEPTGSVSSTVARMMATAGAALSDRVEKYSALSEAKLKAPAMQRQYAGAYSKIASGDYSGFEDMSSAVAMAAGNPLLMGMAKEANDLGVSLANNYTQQAVLGERIKSQQELLKARTGAQSALQEDRQQYDTINDVRAENAKREARNAQRAAALEEERKLSGDPNLQGEPMEPLLPVSPNNRPSIEPTGGVAPEATGANPMGLPERPAQSGSPQAGSIPAQSAPADQSGSVEPALPVKDEAPQEAPSFINSDERIGKIMNDNGLTADDLKNWKSDNGKVVFPDGRELNESDSEYVLSVTDELEAHFQGQAGGAPLVNEKAQPTERTATPADTVELDEVDLAGVTIKVGKPSKKETEGMKLKSATVKTPSGSRTYAKDEDKEGGETDLKARDKFIESVGVMNTDPKASQFIIANWGKSKNPQIGFEEVKDDKGEVTGARMYGIGEDGKRIGFNNGADDNAPYKDGVSMDFYKAYKDMLSTKDKVNSKYGIKLEKKAEAAKAPASTASPWEKVTDEGMRNTIMAVREEVQSGRLTKQEGQRKILAAQAAKEEKVLADDKYKLEDEGQAKKASVNVAAIQKQIASIEEKLNENSKIPKSLASQSWLQFRDTSLSTKERNALILARSNLLKKLREAQ